MIPESYAGYPVEVLKNDFYKRNPHISGSAEGGFDTGQPPFISINGYAPQMKNLAAVKNLLRLEASRHLMNEIDYNPKWDITPSQKNFQESFRGLEGGKYYADNIANSFRETLISRSVGMPLKHGDARNYTWDAQTVVNPETGKYFIDETIDPPPLTDDQIKDRNMFDQMLFNRELINKVKTGQL